MGGERWDFNGGDGKGGERRGDIFLVAAGV